MSLAPIKLHGQVVRERVDLGSKSERSAVLLRATDGKSYVLRRKDGPAFGDTSLDTLVGSSIDVEGLTVGSTLIMHDWRKAG
jgi:hypothetical protein